MGIDTTAEITAVPSESAVRDRVETVTGGIEATTGLTTDVVNEDTINDSRRRVEIGKATTFTQANITHKDAACDRGYGIKGEYTATVGRLVQLKNAICQFGCAVAITTETTAKGAHITTEKAPSQCGRRLVTTNGTTVDLSGILDELAILEGKVRVTCAVKCATVVSGKVVDEDTIANQG